MSKIRVGVVHTLVGVVQDISIQFARQLPEVELVNIADDSLLAEALANKGVTPGIISRMCGYYRNLESIGCACILNSCSSVSEVADIGCKLVNIPVLKVDAPMAKAAALTGTKVAVIATAISTIGPSCRLVEHFAKEADRNVTVESAFVEGAYECLLKTGDKAAHNRMVLEKIRQAAKDHDAIVLAQGSMFHLLPELGGLQVPVFASLESGVAQIRDVLGLN